MIRQQNPFSLYDFLGYFIPGALAIYGVLVSYYHITFGEFRADVFKQAFEAFSYGLYIPFILTSYIVGHLLSYISSITIEKYSIWMHGYPSKYIIGIKPEGYFKPTDCPIRRIIGRSLVILLIFPVSVCDLLFGYLLNLRGLYIKETDKIHQLSIISSILDIIKTASILDIIKTAYREEAESPEDWIRKEDFFRLCYHFALENSVNHNPKMQNYVALFGFTRTLTLLFVVLAWIFFLHIVLVDFSEAIDGSITVILFFISMAVGYIFYLAFNKFFRRFSLEVLMATVVCVNFPQDKT